MATTASYLRTFLFLIFPFATGLLRGATFSVTPASVASDYAGSISLQVSGLNAGERVLIHKYLDSNANGVVDAGDFLAQSFSLTDNLSPAIGGATNTTIPFDSNIATGQITSQLTLQTGGLIQRFTGQYLIVLSSPTSRFTPITNHFTVTPATLSQSISGHVTSGGVNVPYSSVILFDASSSHGLNAVGGAVASASGAFTVLAPPGSYLVIAFKSNYVANVGAASPVTLAAGASATANAILSPATVSISGKLVDAANPAIGIPGVSVPVQTTGGYLSVGFTDEGGNFSVPTIKDKCKVSDEAASLIFHGYLTLQNSTKVDTSAGSVSGVVISLPKAVSGFYGTVTDNLGHPLAGVQLSAGDNPGLYEGDAVSGPDGSYFLPTGTGQWHPGVSSDSPGVSGYVFSQLQDQNINLTNGMAVPFNIVGLPANRLIVGSVKNQQNQGVSGVDVYAYATIGGSLFNQSVTAASDGSFSLPVASGTWNVGVDCQDNNGLQSQGYGCVNELTAVVTETPATVNFKVGPPGSYQISGQVIDTGNNSGISNITVHISGNASIDVQTGPSGFYSVTVGNGNYQVAVDCGQLTARSYSCVGTSFVGVNGNGQVINFSVSRINQTQITGRVTDSNASPVGNILVHITGNSNIDVRTSGDGSYSAAVGQGNWTVAVDCAELASRHYQCGSSQNVNTFGSDAVADFIVLPCAGLQITTLELPRATIGSNYTFQVSYSGCQSPFIWTLTPGSLPLPAGLSISSSGVIGGSPTAAGTNYFSVRVTDGSLATADQLLSIVVDPPLRIVAAVLPAGIPNVTYDAQLSATGGSGNYFGWMVVSGTFPPGLTLFADGHISGAPTSSGTFGFQVSVQDNAGRSTSAPFSIAVNSSLQITSPALSRTFQGVPYTNQLAAAGGRSPYAWSVALGSQPLPAGLKLSGDGLISGVAATNGTFFVIIHAADLNGQAANQTVEFDILPLPRLAFPAYGTGGQFQMSLVGGLGINCAIQYSASLAAGPWIPLISTNPPSNQVLIIDAGASNSARFYRLQVTP